MPASFSLQGILARSSKEKTSTGGSILDIIFDTFLSLNHPHRGASQPFLALL